MSNDANEMMTSISNLQRLLGQPTASAGWVGISAAEHRSFRSEDVGGQPGWQTEMKQNKQTNKKLNFKCKCWHRDLQPSVMPAWKEHKQISGTNAAGKTTDASEWKQVSSLSVSLRQSSRWRTVIKIKASPDTRFPDEAAEGAKL